MPSEEPPESYGKPRRHLWRWIVGIPVVATLGFVAVTRPSAPNSPVEMTQAIVALLTAGLIIALLFSRRRRLLARLFLSASGVYYIIGGAIYVNTGSAWFSETVTVPPDRIFGVFNVVFGWALIFIAIVVRKPLNLPLKFRKSKEKQEDK